MTDQSKKTAKPASKGAEEILLSQIKQEFTTPADAIFDYIEIVEKNIKESDSDISSNKEQLKTITSELWRYPLKLALPSARTKHLIQTVHNVTSCDVHQLPATALTPSPLQLGDGERTF